MNIVCAVDGNYLRHCAAMLQSLQACNPREDLAVFLIYADVDPVELGTLMKELGCWNAINLDGGGSSIMLLATDGKTLRIMNRPSDAGTRPIPVMLAVRPR